jgi:hypothetical protein
MTVDEKMTVYDMSENEMNVHDMAVSIMAVDDITEDK